MENTTIVKNKQDRQLRMSRTFNASRDKVFAAFTTSDALNAWWGPRGWQTTTKEFSFVDGGSWHYCMTCTDKDQGEWYGQESWGKMIYESITEPEGFVYRDYFVDAEGVINPDMPVMTTTMSFIDNGDGTTEVISDGIFDTEAGYDTVIAMGVEQGAAETWDRLDEYVSDK